MTYNRDERLMSRIDENDIEDFQTYEIYYKLFESEDEPKELDFNSRINSSDDFYCDENEEERTF
jgi:hypothetical protein